MARFGGPLREHAAAIHGARAGGIMADLPDGRPVNAASPSLQPVASGERIAVLDVLRGAAAGHPADEHRGFQRPAGPGLHRH